MTTPWEKILSVARFTPSPHNVQPWKVKIINNHQAELFIDPARTLPAEDVTGSFILSTMGMFLEALHIVSLNEGFRFRYSLRNTNISSSAEPFADLLLEPDPSLAPIYSNEIFLKRRTSRLSSKPIPIPQDSLNALSELARKWGQKFDYINDAPEVHDLIEQNITAVFHDMNDPKYHDEIVTWFRYSPREGRKKKDGLEARCMKIPGIEFYLFAHLPRLLEYPGIRMLMRALYRRRLGNIYSLGLISGPFWEKEAALRTGAFLLNFWLEMTKHHLFIHPFGNLVTNQAANRWLHDKTKLKNIWLVFRIGFTDPAPQSHRLDLEDILIGPVA